MYLTTAAAAAATLKGLIASLTERATENPRRVVDYANEIRVWTGIADTLIAWESFCADVAEHFDAGSPEMFIAKYDWIAQHATQSPDDTWSGRGNDGRRSYEDGRRQALEYVRDQVRCEARALVAGAAK